jgi:hypothetical protein
VSNPTILLTATIANAAASAATQVWLRPGSASDVGGVDDRGAICVWGRVTLGRVPTDAGRDGAPMYVPHDAGVIDVPRRCAAVLVS